MLLDISDKQKLLNGLQVIQSLCCDAQVHSQEGEGHGLMPSFFMNALTLSLFSNVKTLGGNHLLFPCTWVTNPFIHSAE